MLPNQPGVCVRKNIIVAVTPFHLLQVAIGAVTRHLLSVAIGLAIGHVQTCHFHGTKVTVYVRISTMAQLIVEHSSDLATVGRTMEASLA